MADRTTTFAELESRNFLELGAGRPRTVHSGQDSPIPILRVGDVLDGRIEASAQGDALDAPGKPLSSKVSRPGDVVLTTKGTVGRVALMPPTGPNFAYSPQLCYFRPAANGPLRSRYLYYWFKSAEFWKQADALKGQTDMADFLSLSDIQSFRIGLPSLERQAGVADLLGALDDKIAVNERIGAAAVDLSKLHFQHAVAGIADPARLGDIVQLVYGRALREPDRRRGPVKVYGCTGPVGVHDVAISGGPSAVVGRKGANAGWVSWSADECWVIDTAFYASQKDPSMSPELTYLMLEAAGLSNLVGDSAVPGLNREIAHSHHVLVPAETDRERLTSMVRPLLAMAVQRETENLKLAELRDALLPRLMSGELRVRDAEQIVGAT